MQQPIEKGNSRTKKLGLLGLMLIVCGIIISLLSSATIYGNESIVYASGYVELGQYSGTDGSSNLQYRGTGGIFNLGAAGATFSVPKDFTNVKQVEIIVSQVPIAYYQNGTHNSEWQILHSFDISLLSFGAQPSEVKYTLRSNMDSQQVQ